MTGRAMRSAFRLGAVGASVAIASAFALPRARAGMLADVTASLSPDSISGLRGSVATVALRMDMGVTGKKLASYTVTITWDSSVVRLDSVRAGDFAAPTVNAVNAGQVRLTQATTAGMGGSFSLARLYYRIVNDTAGKRSAITPAFSEATDSAFTNLLPVMAVTGGAARVLAPPVLVHFSPDSLWERIGYHPQLDLVADLSSAPGVSVGSYAAAFTWDSTVMKLDSIRAGDFAAPQTNQPNAGELHLTSADASGKAGVVSLARLYFSYTTSTYPKTTQLPITVSEMHAAPTFADLLPGVTRKTATVSLGGVLHGDIDVSGSVAALDAQTILQGVVGLSLPSGSISVPNGDADCNGTLTAKDAQIVLNKVVGNDVSAFCVGKIQ